MNCGFPLSPLLYYKKLHVYNVHSNQPIHLTTHQICYIICNLTKYAVKGGVGVGGF